jgi:L-alanine-DL-glutamate epimerase-like enolase superfamily enzyme
VSGSDIPRGHFVHPVSRSAFQTAVTSLRARLSGAASTTSTMPATSYTIAYNDDPEEMARIAVASGFHNLKVKAGIPGDIERITVLRERLPRAVIRVDANQGWSVKEAPEKMRQLERLGVELVEEPIAGTAAEIERVAAASSLPVILDESVRELSHLRLFAHEAPSVAGIVVKIAKNGGPLESIELARAARDMGLRVMVSSMIETSLGSSAALGLAPLCEWCDLDAPLLLAEDPFTGFTYENEVPRLVGESVMPGPELARFIEGLAPLDVGV